MGHLWLWFLPEKHRVTVCLHKPLQRQIGIVKIRIFFLFFIVFKKMDLQGKAVGLWYFKTCKCQAMSQNTFAKVVPNDSLCNLMPKKKEFLKEGDSTKFLSFIASFAVVMLLFDMKLQIVRICIYMYFGLTVNDFLFLVYQPLKIMSIYFILFSSFMH